MRSDGYTARDADLTRGYIMTFLILKSDRYNSTGITKFGWEDFIGMATAILLGHWYVYKFIYTYFFASDFNADIEMIERVYRI